jgi:type II secretory pathway component PulJ
VEHLYRRLNGRRHRDVSDDSGLSVIELMIAMAISLVILGSLLTTLSSGTRAESATVAKGQALQELRDAIARTSTDIRQATNVNPTSTSSRLDIQTLAGGSSARMVFEISGSSFVRTVCPAANFAFSNACGGTPARLVDNVRTIEAFCYDPPQCLAATPSEAMRLVRVTIDRSSTGASNDPLLLGADVQLRNL